MANLDREQVEAILKHIEKETSITTQQLSRLTKPGGFLRGQGGTPEARKYGKVLTPAEQKEIWQKIADEMKLNSVQREKLMRAVRPERLAKTLERATPKEEEPQAPPPPTEKPEGKSTGMAQEVLRSLGLR